VTSPGIRSPITPRGALSGASGSRGSRISPSRNSASLLSGPDADVATSSKVLPCQERIPDGLEFDDAFCVPEGLPSELPRSLLPTSESPPLHRLPYLDSPCESSSPASSRLRPLRDGSPGVLAPLRLGSPRVVPTPPPPANRRSPASGTSARARDDRSGGALPAASTEPLSEHSPRAGARTRFPGPCPPGVSAMPPPGSSRAPSGRCSPARWPGRRWISSAGGSPRVSL
jgi:hypothetical protein